MKSFAIIALLSVTQSRLYTADSHNLAQLSSDPIHGSLGPPKIDPKNLNAEQRFEWEQRNMKPAKIVLDEDVKATATSIKWAEGDLGEDLIKKEDLEAWEEANKKAAEAAEDYKKDF